MQPCLILPWQSWHGVSRPAEGSIPSPRIPRRIAQIAKFEKQKRTKARVTSFEFMFAQHIFCYAWLAHGLTCKWLSAVLKLKIPSQDGLRESGGIDGTLALQRLWAQIVCHVLCHPGPLQWAFREVSRKPGHFVKHFRGLCLPHLAWFQFVPPAKMWALSKHIIMGPGASWLANCHGRKPCRQCPVNALNKSAGCTWDLPLQKLPRGAPSRTCRLNPKQIVKKHGDEAGRVANHWERTGSKNKLVPEADSVCRPAFTHCPRARRDIAMRK